MTIGTGAARAMQMRIVHTTQYEYEGKAVASYNQARLTPTTTPEQIVVHHRLEISPQPWTTDYRDYFGTEVTAFEVVDPHDAMTVRATSTVQTGPRRAPTPVLDWESVLDPAVEDRWTEYLQVPDLVAPPPDLAARVHDIRAGTDTPGEAARAVCDLVHAEVAYRPGSTDVQTSAAVAWEQRSGVCQDMVHLSLGGLRTLGIPARYVSGYFHPSRDPLVGEPAVAESHAWVEWWDDGWHAFDPTNDHVPCERYVSVATGRDYRDVRPLSGIYSGAATSRMTVSVEITRLT